MKHPNILEKIVIKLRETISLPFTVKMRSGWDKDNVNALEVALMLERLGVDAITIHSRTRKQKYEGRADWQLVRKIKENLKIPVILSGDVTNTYMAYMALSHTKCDFIMIARGAMNNPSIFSYLNKFYSDYVENKIVPSKPVSVYDKRKEDVIGDFKEFLDLYRKIELRYRFSELQDHAIWSVREAKNNSELKQKIIESKTEEELLEVVSSSFF